MAAPPQASRSGGDSLGASSGGGECPGGNVGASPSSPPLAAEVVPFEEAARLVDEAFQGADATDEELRLTTPGGLEWLDSLPPGHRDRLGLRFTAYRLGDDLELHQLPYEWDALVPSPTTLSRFVRGGRIEPGTFRVVITRRGRQLPWVRFHVAPLEASRGGALSGLGEVAQLLSLLTGGRPLLPAPSKDRSLHAALSELAQRLEEHGERLEELEQVATQVGQALAQQQASGGAFDWNQLAAQLLPQLFPAAPPAPPADNGRLTAEHLT